MYALLAVALALCFIGAMGVFFHSMYIIWKHWPGSAHLATEEWFRGIVGDTYVRVFTWFSVLATFLTALFVFIAP